MALLEPKVVKFGQIKHISLRVLKTLQMSCASELKPHTINKEAWIQIYVAQYIISWLVLIVLNATLMAIKEIHFLGFITNDSYTLQSCKITLCVMISTIHLLRSRTIQILLIYNIHWERSSVPVYQKNPFQPSRKGTVFWGHTDCMV